MLILYKSNRLDLIIKKMCKQIFAYPQNNLFEKEIFITPNHTFDQWIKNFISTNYKIFSNTLFTSIENFLNLTIKKFFKKKKILHENFNKETIFWILMKMKEIKEIYIKLFKLKHIHTTKIEFCFYLSKIFEKLLTHYTSLYTFLKKKKKNKNIFTLKKYKKIWKKILKIKNSKKKKFFHYSDFFKIFKKKNMRAFLPTRIFILGILNLKPFHIFIIKKISKYTEVHLAFTFPYQKKNLYLSYIKPSLKKKFLRIPLKIKYITTNLKIISKIIKKLIKKKKCFPNLIYLQKEFIKIDLLLRKIKKKTHYIFPKLNKKTELTYIQKNINNNKNISLSVKRKIKKEKSFKVYFVFNKNQEVQTLYKKIIQILKKKKKIFPKDIIIYSPNIKEYLPYIQSIFNSQKNIFIPHAIYSNTQKKKHLLIKLIKLLLSISNSKITNQKIFKLLENPYIKKTFRLKEKKIKKLKRITKNLGIKWGINKLHLKKNKFTKNTIHTWEAGFNRIIRKFFIYEKNYSFLKNYLTEIQTTKKTIKMINTLILFIYKIKKWINKINKSKKTKYWKKIIDYLVNNFFSKKNSIFFLLSKIKKTWEKIFFYSEKINCKKKITIQEINSIYFPQLNIFKKQTTFYPGVINFLDWNLIPNIPFKITYLLGIKKNNFLESYFLKKFQLIKKKKNIKNLISFKKNCLTFTKILISVKKFFFISILVKKSYYNFTLETPFIIQNILTFIKKTTILNKKLFSTKKPKKFLSFTNEEKNHNNLKSHISILKKKIKIIKIKTLTSFWKNPLKFFLNYNFKNCLTNFSESINKEEKFSVSYLKRYKINKEILNFLLKKKNTDILFKFYKENNTLPIGVIGKIFWNEQIKKINQLIEKIFFFKKTKSKKKKISLIVKKTSIKGKITNLYNNKIIRWDPSNISINYIMSVWIEHIIHCSQEKKSKQSIILGVEKKNYILAKLSQKKALQYLHMYIKGFKKGITNPIFLTKSGYLWINKIFCKKTSSFSKNKEKKNIAKKILKENWNGNFITKGEKNNIYIKRIIQDIKKKNLKKIFKNSKKWYTPLIKNIKNFKIN